MGFIIAAAVAAAIIAFCFLCYKKAPPTQAIVVTGFGLSRPKVVCGRGVFVLPIVQRADRLNMRLLKIDVKTPETGVKTKEGVSLWLDSVVTVQVYSENSTVSDEEVRNAGYDDIRTYINSRQQAAISNFLGMDEAHINEKINDVLQGNLREIVSEMTVDQILTNRKQMAVSVVENARPDLAKMGLEVVTFNVQDVKDAVDAMGHNHGVIEAIGVEQEELVKKRASIAKAEAERDALDAQRRDDLIQPRAHRRIADAQLFFHFTDVAAVAQEGIDKGTLLRRQGQQTLRLKIAFNRRTAGGAVQPGDMQCLVADRAIVKHIVCHNGSSPFPGGPGLIS